MKKLLIIIVLFAIGTSCTKYVCVCQIVPTQSGQDWVNVESKPMSKSKTELYCTNKQNNFGEFASCYIKKE